MLTSLFLKGSLIGFSIAMPVGPIGVLCIQHSLKRGILAGVVAGFGAALADAFYGCLAGFGFSLLAHVLLQYQVWFQMIGSGILLYLGIRIFNSKPAAIEGDQLAFSLRRIFLSTFALTLTNPLTILCFAGMYAGLGVAPAENEILPALILTFGVWLGAALWWLILSLGVTLIGKKLRLASSPLLNRISGLVITGLGCMACIMALQQLLF